VIRPISVSSGSFSTLAGATFAGLDSAGWKHPVDNNANEDSRRNLNMGGFTGLIHLVAPTRNLF
jgi:hypothetical protein